MNHYRFVLEPDRDLSWYILTVSTLQYVKDFSTFVELYQKEASLFLDSNPQLVYFAHISSQITAN